MFIVSAESIKCIAEPAFSQERAAAWHVPEGTLTDSLWLFLDKKRGAPFEVQVERHKTVASTMLSRFVVLCHEVFKRMIFSETVLHQHRRMSSSKSVTGQSM
jgi:hypothetical protein